MAKIKVSVLGASGYTAREALKALLAHPSVAIAELVSRRQPSPHIAELHKELGGLLDKRCSNFDAQKIARSSDAVLSCLPHRSSFEVCGQLVDLGCRVVDLSADYRFQDVATYEQWYDVQHGDKAHLSQAVYGLPEMHREQIRAARLVANPGCYPTAVVLAALPLVARGLAKPEGPIIADATSGVSGAGRKVADDYMFCRLNENTFAYRVGKHQHQPEMEAVLEAARGGPAPVIFTPHLAPLDRGIVATVYVPLNECPDDLTEFYADFFREEPFVRVLPSGEWPETKAVAFTNFCSIGVACVGEYAVAVAAIDNLVKGASGQAVQNLNVMFGLDETAGLI